MAENQQPTPQHASKKEETSIVRIAGRDINGNYTIAHALMQIKGVNQNLAHAMALVAERTLNIKTTEKIGLLEESAMEKLEEIIKEPGKFGIPSFMLNRRNDTETGSDIHVVGTDLIIKTKNDMDDSIKRGTWIGFRRQYGQRVRGQRTRSTGRTGATVGVTKKKIQEAAKASKESEKKPSAANVAASAPAAK